MREEKYTNRNRSTVFKEYKIKWDKIKWSKGGGERVFYNPLYEPMINVCDISWDWSGLRLRKESKKGKSTSHKSIEK